MIDIKEKKNCCGCNACYDICPKDAITLSTDIEGFWYPRVDIDKCINCGLCERTCPQLHIGALKKNDFEYPVCFAAIHKNIEVQQLKNEHKDICTFCRENTNSTLVDKDNKILLYFDSSTREIGITNKDTGEINFIRFKYCPECGRKIY